MNKEKYQYNAIVKRVVDGDTIDVDIDLGFGMWIHNERVRLAGIDTPECRTKDETEKHFGLLAKTMVESLVTAAPVIIETTLIKGKFGRTLGIVYLPDVDQSLNDFLIEKRFAIPYTGKNKAEGREQHEENWTYLTENGMA